MHQPPGPPCSRDEGQHPGRGGREQEEDGGHPESQVDAGSDDGLLQDQPADERLRMERDREVISTVPATAAAAAAAPPPSGQQPVRVQQRHERQQRDEAGDRRQLVSWAAASPGLVEVAVTA